MFSQEQGRSTDFLFGMRSAMVGLAKLSSAVLGSNTLAHGLACTPTSPASMQVNVGLGEIYQVATLDGTAYGVLPADTTDTILKQGIQLGTVALSCPAPTTSGFSVNFLIEASYSDSDTNPVVLPYFNSANPSQPLNGPGGLGGTNPTQRQGLVSLQAKAGTAATSGTQTTPTPDSGYVGLWVVTVAFGATTITSGNIAQYSGAPFITNILQMLQTGSAIYAQDTSAVANTITLALTPPVTSYSDGEPIRFKAANTNTGAVTINWGGGTISLTGTAGALQGGEVVALKQYEAIYSSATGTAILIGQSAGPLQVAPATASQHAAQLGQVQGMSSVRGMRGTNGATATSQMAWTADAVTVRNPTTGATNTIVGVSSITTDVTVAAAANGRDTSAAIAASSWVHYYFIWNGTTLATIASLQLPTVGPALPTGYTSYAYIGAVYYGASSTLATVRFRGTWAQYLTPGTAVSGGTATTLTSVSLATFVPPNVLQAKFNITQLGVASNSSGVYSCNLQLLTETTGQAYQTGLQGTGSAAVVAYYSSGGFTTIALTSQGINYLITVTTGSSPTTTIFINGYSVPNGDAS